MVFLLPPIWQKYAQSSKFEIIWPNFPGKINTWKPLPYTLHGLHRVCDYNVIYILYYQSGSKNIATKAPPFYQKQKLLLIKHGLIGTFFLRFAAQNDGKWKEKQGPKGSPKWWKMKGMRSSRKNQFDWQLSKHWSCKLVEKRRMQLAALISKMFSICTKP